MNEKLVGQREYFMRGYDAGFREGAEYALKNTILTSFSDRDRIIKDSVTFLVEKYKDENKR